MTDETPDTGSVFADLTFTAGAMVMMAVATLGFHSLGEALRRKERKEERGR